MPDSVQPWNGQQIIAQNAQFQTSNMQSQFDQQRIKDMMGLIQDVKHIDPAMSIVDQLNKAQALALAHGQIDEATKMSNMIAQTSQRIATTEERVAKTQEEKAKTDEITRKNVFAALGTPDSPEAWQQAQISAHALYPNMPPDMKKFIDQPFTPELQKYLGKVGIDAKKQAEIDLEKKRLEEVDASIQEKKALAGKHRADTEATRTMSPLKQKAESALATEREAQAALAEAREEQERKKVTANQRNAGKNITKLTDATKEDKTDVGSILSTRFSGLKGNDLEEARRTIAQEAKARQAKEGGDIATAAKKILAEQPGRIYKTDDGKMKFKDIPPDVPAGYQFKGKVSSDGRRVWQKPGGKDLVEKE